MVNSSMAWWRNAMAFIVPYLLVGCSSGRAEEDCEEPLAQRQERITSLLARVTPAVVAINFHGRYDSSGVIVSERGLVLTHAHHTSSVMHEPETKGTMEFREAPIVLSDGRTVTARLVATYSSYVADVEYSLLQITTEGNWPHVEVASGDCPQRGDWCLHLGHPLGYQEGRPPVPKLGRIVAATESKIASSCMIVPGDSGGPLFDREGRVIGIATGMWGFGCRRPSHHTNVAILRSDLLRLEQRDRKDNLALVAMLVERRPRSPLWQEVGRDARGVTVQVYCDDAPTILGTIVNREGWVVTKRSELTGELTCQLMDGRRVAARLVAEAPDFDVALLKLDSDLLADAVWRRERPCVRGEIVASVGMTPDPIGVGIVGDARQQSIPAESGSLRLPLEATKDGLRVGKLESSKLPYARPDLREGDLLVSIEGRNLNTLADYSDFWKKRRPTAGEPISLLIRRQGESLTIRARPTRWDMFNELDEAGEASPRRSGFPAVIIHDGVLTREQCGGPVVDVSGKIIGINIARAGRHATYTIPASKVLELTQRLRSSGQ